jgi:hypothetical protein
MSWVDVSRWNFGGPLADAPTDVAWTILLIAAALCVVFSWVSYRTSVRRLGIAPSFLLMLLRTGFLVVLLLCFANPVRIEHHTNQPPEPPPPPPPATPHLAVVVDRSDSMTLADNRGRTRLSDALVNWRRLEKTAEKFFTKVDYYSFAEDLRPAATLDEALSRTGGTSETRLYQSLTTLLKNTADHRPTAIVVLTDGVDTSNDSSAESSLRETAVAAGVPVHFVAGTNRSARPDPFLRVREWRVPPTALRNSGFAIEVVFEAFSRADRTVPYSLWQSGRRVGGGDVALTLGSNVVAQTLPASVGEPGPVEFELRLGAGDRAPVAARALTRVLAPQDRRLRLLVYEGELDWGFRHLIEALRTDSNFEFLTLVNASAGVTFARVSAPGTPALGQMPDRLAALTRFDCVVIVRPDPRRFSPAQQQALAEYVRQGGAVFFVSPDPSAMASFAGGAFLEILPVVVDPNARPMPSDIDNLVPFLLTDAGNAGPIFVKANAPGAKLLPRFQEYAAVSQLKPGAQALAVHPTAVDPTSGQRHILLATQIFGRGRSALLTTDTLWRWKLDEPAASRAIETFWQQALLEIARPQEPPSMRILNVPASAGIGQTAKMRVTGISAEKPPEISARGPDGRTTLLKVTATQDTDAPWSFDWTPEQAGNWELTGRLAGAYGASAFPFVVADVTGELARSEPALAALAALAGDTGGKLLNQQPPADWQPELKQKEETPPEPVTSERKHPLWSIWTMLLVALSLYAAELIFRRLFKLL